MATYGYTFQSGDGVTPTRLNNARTVSNIVDADISATAAIAATKLSTAAQQALIPAGAVMPFAMNSAPSGWLAANGDAVSRSTYAALFTAIGTTYGAGDGSTTFALPDLRGYFVRGSGTNSDSVASGTFGAKQAASLLNHTHTGTTGTESADHTHTFNVTSGGESSQHGHTANSIITTGLGGSSANITTGGGGYRIDNVATTFNGSGHTHSVSGTTSGKSATHTHTVTTGNPSAGGGTETRPANIALLYCIKH